MNKKERLLRASALILIVRDEWEEQELHPEWCEAATTYIDELAIDEVIKQQYENYFSFVDGLIRTVADPGEVANELFVVLRKDLNQSKVTNKIIHATNAVKVEGYDVGKVKLIDSVTNKFSEK
jgi:hypothetical protein